MTILETLKQNYSACLKTRHRANCKNLFQELRMTPNSLIFELWRKPIVDVYMKIYIFNITNAEEFLEGGVKLKVEEVGPYVYQ